MVFFITGGSRGIGRGIVLEALAVGHDVAFTYATQEQAAHEVCREAAGRWPERRCKAYQLDIAHAGEVERVGDAVLEAFDTVDVVVNNAGINRPGLAMSLGDAEWHESIQTNLSGPFFVARHFIPTFLAARSGRFIHISSVSEGGMAGQIAYSASKAGLAGLSGALAKEYGRKGITSNLVVLGFFDTDMTRTQMAEQNKKDWLRLCPAGRNGSLSEASAAVLFLASKEAAFINGHALHVTGGLDWFL